MKDIEQKLSALRDAAAFLISAETGGTTKIHIEFEGGGYERSWVITISYGNGGRSIKGHGRGLDAAIDSVINVLETELRRREDEVRLNCESVRKYIGVARGKATT